MRLFREQVSIGGVCLWRHFTTISDIQKIFVRGIISQQFLIFRRYLQATGFIIDTYNGRNLTGHHFLQFG
jgi:hypothetical protein